jgi:hypothetical protein
MWRRLCWPLYRWFLRHDPRPILVGPFRGEVGLEVFYWVPFIKALGITPDRLIPVTRGGAHLWYETPRHVELFSLRTPRQMRIENAHQHKLTGMVKQKRWTRFDRDVIHDAAKTLGLTHYHVLHPAWMYCTLESFWLGRRGLEWLVPKVKLGPFPEVEGDGLTLPAEFVAVRFYYRHTFPVTEQVREVVIDTITQLAKVHTVIVMNWDGVQADEHGDVPLPENMPNVIQLKWQKFITTENNLSVQSAVLSKALGFVGTYGGVAHLATMHRKPVVAFYESWGGTMIAHKHLADFVATAFGVACHIVPLRDFALLRLVLPTLTPHNASSTTSTGAPDPVFGTTLSGSERGIAAEIVQTA